MKELKGSTKAGKRILAMLDRHCGVYLDDVYSTYSNIKYTEWRKLWDRYMEDKQGYCFHMCSANSSIFTCGWYTWEDEEQIALYFTHKNHYKVYMDR